MDPHPVDVGAEVVELVQPALLLAPVEPVCPVREHVAQIRDVRALIPPGIWQLLGPARVPDTRSQVVEALLLLIDREGLHVHRRLPLSPTWTCVGNSCRYVRTMRLSRWCCSDRRRRAGA